jgi:2-polyprenyl-6-methoxyphenol hydroxylase-like FAD-dependent oxidoreductase
MKPVLISGAGLGGLLLARSLRSHSIPFEIFERDAHVAARGQGYRIRISNDGLKALKAVLTESQFNAFQSGTAQTGGGGIHNLDGVTGEPTEPTNPKDNSSDTDLTKPKPKLGGDVLGVARGFLRSELIKGFEDKVHWNQQVKGYERSTDTVRAIFADGTKSVEGSLLIAADGPQSAVTKQLTNGKVRAYDTGARMIHGQTRASAFKQLGNGVWFVADSTSIPNVNLGLITNVRPGVLDDADDETELGWVFLGSPGSFDAPGGDFRASGKVAADLSRELTKKWHPKIRVVLEEQNDAEAVFLKMSTARPEGVPEWESDARVTVLGDAVHCMTPAGGVGANTALRDAELLGRLIGEAGGWREGLTREYEEEMRVYASANVKMSFEEVQARFKITELK